MNSENTEGKGATESTKKRPLLADLLNQINTKEVEEASKLALAMLDKRKEK